ncbi:MAG: hypothetical protein NTU60_00265 [Candidatus Aminicenantes bacterium]|nr:hypothetical protein [Candidatus Aminicenantes bacterium]
MLKEGRIPAAAIVGLVLGALFVRASIQGPPGLPLLAQYDFENGKTDGWLPKDPGHWRVVKKDGSMAYELTAPGEQGTVRAPTSWSLLSGHDVTSFVFTGRLQCYAEPANLMRDMCVIFHYQDPSHFYYVHFAASSDGLHNVIALVNGTDRVKINTEPEGKSVFRLTDMKWHDFKVTCDGATGEIKAYLDDMSVPILTARDTTLREGFACPSRPPRETGPAEAGRRSMFAVPAYSRNQDAGTEFCAAEKDGE